MRNVSRIIGLSLILLLCFTSYTILAVETTQTALILEKSGEIDTVSVPLDLQIVDDIMYVVTQQRLLIFDISDITSPVQIGEFQDSGTGHGIHVVGDYALVADIDEGLEIYNISDFDNIRKIHTYYPGQDVTEVLIDNSLCFLSVDGSKFILLNSSEILNMNPLGEYNITSAMSYQRIDDLVYIADYTSGLLILNISDPTNPTLLSQYNDGEEVRAVNVDQNITYISCGIDGYKILETNDINNPTLVSEIADVSWGIGHIKHENLIYVCDYDEGLRIYDVSNTNSPLPYGIYECEMVFNVFLKGEYLILLKARDGMIDIVKIISPMTRNDDSSPILIIGGIGAAVFLAAIIVLLKKRK